MRSELDGYSYTISAVSQLMMQRQSHLFSGTIVVLMALIAGLSLLGMIHRELTTPPGPIDIH